MTLYHWLMIGVIAWVLLSFIAACVAGHIIGRMERRDRRAGYPLPPIRKVRDHPVEDGADVFHAADAARRIH